MFRKRLQLRTGRRRAAAAGIVVVSLTVIMGMAAFAVDSGMLYRARAELQNSADAAALAAAAMLVDNDRLRGETYWQQLQTSMRQRAAAVAATNRVLKDQPSVDLNSGNAAQGDVVLGILTEPDNLSQPMTPSTSRTDVNTVTVRVRRNSLRNGPVDLMFANIFGIASADVGAEAAAICKPGIKGFKVTPKTGNAELLPLALHKDSWDKLIAKTVTTGDNFSYNKETGTVTAGSDGILELNLYPGSGGTQLPPGNFGTVDIGSSNNSTADLARQIRYGVSQSDLAYLPGGKLELGPNGTVVLNGDTGLSAGIKDDLEAIKGKARAIPIFTKVTGPGNNAMFTVVGFVGIRILDVKLTGSMSSKSVIIQPAPLLDDAAIPADEETVAGSNLFTPVRLVR